MRVIIGAYEFQTDPQTDGSYHSVVVRRVEDLPLLQDLGIRLLGEFESDTRPGTFYQVTESRNQLSCTCWPFVRGKTCRHADFVRRVLQAGVTITKPIKVSNSKE